MTARRGSLTLEAVTTANSESATEGTLVTVGGQPVVIGHLSYGQWWAVGLIASKVVDQVLAKIPQKGSAKQKRAATKEAERELKGMLGEALAGGLSFEGVLKGLDPDTVIQFYAVLTDMDEAFLRDTFRLSELIRVLGALNKTGELREVAAAFKEAASGWGSPSGEHSSNQPSE